MIRLSHHSEVMDARAYFYKEMMRNRMRDVLKRVPLGLLGVCSLMMIFLCAYMYGLIG
ncbi:hypothetical protein [Prevotella melaninogenica]|uniref:hypothetical protein n=1 Tax=Prevotella melaninogenica TaxID=28132 RepID=UPI001C607C8E|nr:hypothetical protein [Prevotella melaninogenica]MBW4728470.1 hypothetical protein [Prevotella melaninogenica]MBW4731109.1 hypothetical protein [Prevotella melaninogenica]MBW4749268.1 hypothetical protein [Prevotella melaninogenica]